MPHSPIFLELVNSNRTNIKECSVNEINSMNQNNNLDGILIDVREFEEWENGHLPNAIHLSKGSIESKIEKYIPNKKQKLYLYCGGGYRSVLAGISLKEMGYANIVSVDGGFRQWSEKGYTIIISPYKHLSFKQKIKDAKKEISEISSDILQMMLKEENITLIDIREKNECSIFNIKGAYHLSRGLLEVKIESLIPSLETPICVYSNHGNRSALAALSLMRMGYKQVYSLQDGLESFL